MFVKVLEPALHARVRVLENITVNLGAQISTSLCFLDLVVESSGNP